jgi:hypothetical protein
MKFVNPLTKKNFWLLVALIGLIVLIVGGAEQKERGYPEMEEKKKISGTVLFVFGLFCFFFLNKKLN